MTPQEIFDKAVSGVTLQGRAARGVDKQCAYRGADGTKCAVGHLIPDEMYSPKMEGQDVTHESFDALWLSLGPVDMGLIRELQAAHDCAAFETGRFVKAFSRRCCAIALKRGLSCEVLEGKYGLPWQREVLETGDVIILDKNKKVLGRVYDVVLADAIIAAINNAGDTP